MRFTPLVAQEVRNSTVRPPSSKLPVLEFMILGDFPFILAVVIQTTLSDKENHLVTCYQLTVTGSGTASPATVKLPGAYAASNPGILINIYQTMTTYAAPGPTVYAGGSTKSAGAACAACESTCTAAAKRAVETAF